ncbi:hypothetical protein VNI00_007214 [Paramarasmius palmivorus]|uniref:Uncharacterized protein n=1 Tax=Paramarasmius palmivorus TaxID=297713 RepID=A0AAW0D3U0_9AGAR
MQQSGLVMPPVILFFLPSCPDNAKDDMPSPSEPDDWVYLTTAAERLFEEWVQWERRGDKEAFLQWALETCRKKTEEFMHLRICKDWVDEMSPRQESETKCLRQVRFNMITRKLKEMGWTEELGIGNSRRQLEKHKLVNQPRLLTEQGWDNISSTLDAFMSSVKTNRLTEQRSAAHGRRRHLLTTKLLTDYSQRLPRGLFLPGRTEITLFEPFRRIIEDTPPSEKVEASHFDGAFTQLLPFVEDWNRNRREKALQALQAYHPGATADHLTRVTSLFVCCDENCVYSYEGVVGHPPMLQCPSDAEWRKACEPRMHVGAIEKTKHVCELYGINPETTSFRDMLARNPLLECLTCRSKGGIRCILRWTALFEWYSPHLKEDHEIIAVPEADLPVILERENASNVWLKSYIEDLRWYICKECDYRHRLRVVKSHLRKVHGIEQDINEHWELIPSANLAMLGPNEIKLYPPGRKGPPIKSRIYDRGWGSDSDH